ncbi:AAA family ATPase [Bacillus sp. T33-2]|uniref:AAA family ATPase n=1 Tax=Bacillus sp. T33-2 TaxID=2054168 RepID=UPI000C761FCF|nr:AAA family ATPase [Bacillus sp. T33-2]PLR93230.1 ATPase [Bacillus sp. T33-2]
MLIKFISLNLQNYKSHRDLSVNFGEVTKITGDNAKGKSSILESISWILYGTDSLGGKLDPTPITYAADETIVQLLLSVDAKQLLLGRGLKKGKAQYYINEVPSKAKEFEELVKSLFDKDTFLSLYNPSYFFTLHWEKQRAMLLQYVTAPARKEVLNSLPEAQGETLEKYLKKHSLDDLEKIHKENKNTKEKKYIAAQSRTKTLQEQLEQLSEQQIDIESVKAELTHIDMQVRDLEKQLDSAFEKNQDFNSVQSQIRNLQNQIEMSKERWPALKNEEIEDTCRTCKRPLDDDAVEAVTADKEKRIEQYKASHNELVTKRKELQARLAELDYIEVSDIREKIREIHSSGQPLRQAIHTYDQYKKLETAVKTAEADEAAILQDLNSSIFILDCIKAYRAKEAELQAEKVQALFTTLSVRLFKQNKGDGEIKPDFEIEMDGKPYSKLSLSESIRAGLELRDVLSQQSELIVPTFIDNSESITSFKEPNGQLIISRVVAGQELKIEGEAAE